MDTATQDDPQTGVPTDDELAAQQAAQDIIGGTREALVAASQNGQGVKGAPTLTAEGQSLAVEWFLSNEEIPAEKTLDVNVGARTVPWTIKAIDADALKQARKMSEEGSRTQKRARAQSGVAAEVDQAENNARVVIAGTVDPDLRKLAAEMQAKIGFVDHRPDKDAAAVELLRDRFANKPGIIDMLAGEIVVLSGYDDEAVVEHAAGKA